MSDSQPCFEHETEATNDAQLLRDLRAELAREEAAPPAAIHTAVQHAVAIVSGSVPGDSIKAAVLAAARRVAGIQYVHDDIRVEPDGNESDEQILACVKIMLGLDAAVAPDRLVATVANGCVTIGGHVEWPAQAHAAVAAVRRVRGVRQVVSTIRVDGLPSLATMRARLVLAFREAGEKTAGGIDLAVSDTSVQLSGTVRSHHDRELAETTIRGLIGVAAVENHLIIG